MQSRCATKAHAVQVQIHKIGKLAHRFKNVAINLIIAQVMQWKLCQRFAEICFTTLKFQTTTIVETPIELL